MEKSLFVCKYINAHGYLLFISDRADNPPAFSTVRGFTVLLEFPLNSGDPLVQQSILYDSYNESFDL